MLSLLRHPGVALRHHIETRTRGQSLVEFALILPVFMLFFAAVLDLGRIAAAEISVTNAAREGAFQAAKTPTDFNSTLPCPANGQTNVIFCRIKLESSGGVAIAASDVSVVCNPVSCATGIGNTVQVVVNGHFRLLTPLMAVFFGGNQNITFKGSATSNLETLPISGTQTPAPTATATPTPSPTPVGATPTPTAVGATPTPTAVPTASPTPVSCVIPSAGFTFDYGTPSHQSPQTITVTDTSTSQACGISTWFWTWGDGTTSLGKIPGPHTYIVPNPDKSGYYLISLQVANAAGSTTFGGVQVQVK
jgi:Flp pilus assembly protein TadG